MQFNGSFVTVSAPKLGAVAIKSALEKSKVPGDMISDVYMGNVLQGSVGQAPARQAAIYAGLPPTAEAVTINKVCASGLKSVALAAQNIQLGLAAAQLAGGMESMSHVPYYVPRSTSLPPFGHVTMEDGLLKDGLTDAYDGFHMGVCAEATARKHAITREMQDGYAVASYKRAQAAWEAGAFTDEIAPVSVEGRKKGSPAVVVDTDEGFADVKLDKVPTLKPAFVRDGTGTVTAANSSTLNDGASALVLGSRAVAREYGSQSRVLARICSSADAAVDPVDFPVAPAKAVPIALERAGISKDQVAVWEFNEAFAAVIKANEKVSRGCPSRGTESPGRKCLADFASAVARSRGRQGQSPRRRHFARARPGKLWIPDTGHVASPAEARRVRRGCYLQRGRCGHGHGGSADRLGLTCII